MFSRPALQDALAAVRCEVFAPTALRVRLGVNEGDDLTSTFAPHAGDIYRLAADARSRLVRLTAPGPDGMRRIGLGSDAGSTGSAVSVTARLVFMAADGVRSEVLVLRPRLPDGRMQDQFLLPLQPLVSGTDLTLIRIDPAPDTGRLPDQACGMLGRGARVLLADGTPRRVEALRPGDRLRTRDHGAQPVLWIGRTTVRAVGVLAPVVIGQGAMGNAGTLTVGAQQRLLLYQSDRRPGQATAEVLVRAGDMVDDDKIRRRDGGFIDYLCVVFGTHEIIYAEGIPTESLLVTETTLCRLPDRVAADLRAQFPTLSHHPHFGTDARPADLDRLGRAVSRAHGT